MIDLESKLIEYVNKKFEGDSSGHDVHHSLRVYKNALKLAKDQECDKELIMMSALLHDVDDFKLFKTSNYENARKILTECNINESRIEEVIKIISTVSFKGTSTKTPDTLEGKIVQDADRLDAIGAIGIARTFAYGGSRGNTMYDPAVKPKLNMNESEYKNHRKGTTVNHFYEKLFLLKDLLNTQLAKEIANKRVLFMEKFLDEFYLEWDSKDF